MLIKGFKVTKVALTAAMAGLLFGFDTGVISGAQLFIQQEFLLPTHALEQLVSIVLLGAWLGALSGGRLCDKVGRKPTLLLTALLFLLGTLWSYSSLGLYSLLSARFILGLAIGMASFSAPLYLAEISPKNQRGKLVSLNQLAITLGILLSYGCNYFYAANSQWRMMLLIGIYPAIALFVGVLFLPESPRYLFQRGRSLKARLYAQKLMIEDELMAELSSAKRPVQSFLSIFKQKSSRRLLIIGVTLAICLQVTGINTIIYYAPKILTMAGFHQQSALFNTLLIGAVNVLATCLAFPLIDYFGRRQLLKAGLSIMGLCLLVLAWLFCMGLSSPLQKTLCIASMLVYIAAFAASFGPVAFVVLAEIFPQAMRATGMGIALSANWLSNMLLASVFLSLFEWIGPSALFLMLSLMCGLSLVFVQHCIVETNKKSLEELHVSSVLG